MSEEEEEVRKGKEDKRRTRCRKYITRVHEEDGKERKAREGKPGGGKEGERDVMYTLVG